MRKWKRKKTLKNLFVMFDFEEKKNIKFDGFIG